MSWAIFHETENCTEQVQYQKECTPFERLHADHVTTNQQPKQQRDKTAMDEGNKHNTTRNNNRQATISRHTAQRIFYSIDVSARRKKSTNSSSTTRRDFFATVNCIRYHEVFQKKSKGHVCNLQRQCVPRPYSLRF